MKSKPAFFLVVDLEATCDEDHHIPRQQTEIIEIGAVLVDGETLIPTAEFATFVRPIVHRKITPFCTQLTGIAQADVDAAPLFPQAMSAFGRFLAGRDVLLSSWGDYDKHQLTQDCRRHGVRFPYGAKHLNLKKAFSDALGETKSYGMASALRRIGLPLLGKHHRGIDDARNIARLLPCILGSVAVRSDVSRSEHQAPRKPYL